MNKRALITGVTGQDGAYLADLLLQKGYEVIGGYRRAASTNFWRLDYLGCSAHKNLTLIELDLTDPGGLIRVLDEFRPNEVYNLAAQSFVATSFSQPILTAQVTGMGAANLLEAVRLVDRDIKFYQASTSEMFGLVQEVPQSETTPLYPRSPYACAKTYAHWMTINYRESYDIFASCGILFNHESPLRGREFVTRKITEGMARIAQGSQQVLELGNLDAKRDWGFAGDYVEGMWRMLQGACPDTYVLATGRTETVRDFVSMTAKALDIELEWHGSGVDERGFIDGVERVRVNPQFFRPAEVDLLIGNPEKAKRDLGWVANKNLEELCQIMVTADLNRAKTEV